MLLLKALQEELDDGSFIGHEVIFLFSWCFEIFFPIAIDFGELPFFGLLEKGCIRSSKNFEINSFEVMERFFIQEKRFPINMGSKNNRPVVMPLPLRLIKVKRLKKALGEGGNSRYSQIISKPYIITQQFGCSWEGATRVRSKIMN